MAVSTKEVQGLLRRVGDGEVMPKLAGRGWSDIFCGNVEFNVDGWIVIIFNDSDEFDYIDSVVAPDGRRGCFDDWFGLPDDEGDRAWEQPDSLLYVEDEACFRRMVAAFERAPGGAKWARH